MIQTLLFVAGINTLLQALFGTRLPAVVGGSFAYVIPVAYIIGDSSLQRINDPHEVSFLHHSHHRCTFKIKFGLNMIEDKLGLSWINFNNNSDWNIGGF